MSATRLGFFWESDESVHPERACCRVLMAAGGTGGHIFPALAVAEELRRRAQRRAADGESCTVEFLGTGRGLEARLIPAAGFPLRTVRAAGLKGIGGWRKVQNLTVLPRSAVETALILREFQPDVVVGMGGYAAGPVLLEAALRDIPTLLIEPNVVPGFTNRVLAPVVRLAAVGFAETALFYGVKARVTGHPVREAFFQTPPKEHIPPFTVMILGGSQGAGPINACVMKSLSLFAAEMPGLRFIHQTGDRDYNGVRQAYAEAGITAEVYPFIEKVAETLGDADLVISRAGALTVAELAAAGKAAVLVPFAAAADQHQRENARAFERVGAARVVDQGELTPPKLVAAVRELLSIPERLQEMEQRARGLATPGAAARIADLIEELAR